MLKKHYLVGLFYVLAPLVRIRLASLGIFSEFFLKTTLMSAVVEFFGLIFAKNAIFGPILAQKCHFF